MEAINESAGRFDDERAITAYRDVILERDRARTAELKDEFDLVARRLRAIWKHWHGTDNLHDRAFGSSDSTSSR